MQEEEHEGARALTPLGSVQGKALGERGGVLASEDVQDATIRTELQQSASLFLALLDLKLGFVQQMPWLVWQMRASRAAAQKALRDFDAAVATASNSIHPVTMKFCSVHGPLREHLQVSHSTACMPNSKTKTIINSATMKKRGPEDPKGS